MATVVYFSHSKDNLVSIEIRRAGAMIPLLEHGTVFIEQCLEAKTSYTAV